MGFGGVESGWGWVFVLGVPFWAGFGAGCGWLFVIDWVFGGLGCCCAATGPANKTDYCLGSYSHPGHPGT